MAKQRVRNISGVTVGPCVNGMRTVSATITFPASAMSKTATAKIVLASSTGTVVSSAVMSDPIGSGNYSASLQVPPGGPYKAIVEASSMVHVIEAPVTTSQFGGCTMGPSPVGASGADEVCIL